MPKLHAGATFEPLRLTNIHGASIAIPDTERRWVHLHFARFAACPICNVHVQSLVSHARKIAGARVREVVLFHSPPASLLPYQGNMPFDVVGDPQKALYRTFEVEASPRALLDPRVWPTLVRAQLDVKKPKGPVEGGALGLPADVLIAPDGRIKAVHYGKYATDVWSVEQLLAIVQN